MLRSIFLNTHFLRAAPTLFKFKTTSLFPMRSIYRMASFSSIPSFSKITLASQEKLLTAIKKGDASSDCFKDKNLHLNLFQLLDSKKISLEEGMTSYMYLLAQMEFTNGQPLRDEDREIKYLRNVEIDRFSKEGKLISDGRFYFCRLQQRLKEMGFPKLDEEAFMKEAFALPPSEQWLIRIHIPEKMPARSDEFNSGDDLLEVLIKNVPCFVPFLDVNYRTEFYSEENFYWVPSASLIQLIMKHLFKKPFDLHFGFGAYSVEQTAEMHANNQHPIALYNKEDANNLKVADGYRCGPFMIFIHDIQHAFIGSLLEEDGRQYIFKDLMPSLFRQKKTDLFAKLDELDLTPVERYTHAKDGATNAYLDNILTPRMR